MRISVYVVGSNPLPVMIALSYDCGLLEGIKVDGMPEKVVMVYTERTEIFARNIEKWAIKKGLSINIELVKIDDAYNAISIYKKIKTKVSELINPNIKEIFINATGGTKVMASNSILSLIDFCKDKKLNMIELDIDSEKNELIIIDALERTIINIYPKYTEPLNSYYKDIIKIQDIVDVHEYAYVKDHNNDYTLKTIENTIKFSRCIMDNYNAYRELQTLIFGFRTIFNEQKIMNKIMNKIKMGFNLDNMYEKFNITDKNINKLKKLIIDKDDKTLKTDALFTSFEQLGNDQKSLINTFCEFGLITKEGDLFSIDLNNYKFFTGVWLEEYIMALIEEMIQDKETYEIQNNFNLYPANGSSNDTEFEIDVVVRNGFDISFFSCTTDQYAGMTNQKIYQVLSNADSLGLRTKAIMVTMADKNSSYFENRYKAFPHTMYKEIKFITFKDLKDEELLKNRLKEILKIKG